MSCYLGMRNSLLGRYDVADVCQWCCNNVFQLSSLMACLRQIFFRQRREVRLNPKTAKPQEQLRFVQHLNFKLPTPARTPLLYPLHSFQSHDRHHVPPTSCPGGAFETRSAAPERCSQLR